MSKIIDGNALSSELKEKIKKEISGLKRYGVPGLATILVGENPASKIYVNLKHKSCEEVGINSVLKKFPENTKEEDVVKCIKELNEDKNIHGILVQLPLPKHINEKRIMNLIKPEKDVDGFHPVNMGNLMIGNEGLVPCTPKGIIYMLSANNIELKGKDVVIVNHSNVVGKPLAAMFLNRNSTVTVCHVYTKNLTEYTIKADILVVGVGIPNFIKEDMVKENAIVIDVGINRVEGKTVGDVDFEKVKNKASLITPVPGGVGPMTIAMLLTNTLTAFKNLCCL